MKLGEYELNNIYCADCYEAIKKIPDNSIDCIYTDIPYLYEQGGSGNSELGERTAKKRLALMGVDDSVVKMGGGITYGELLKQAKKNKDTDRISIENGIDYTIFEDFCRVLKHINIFIWCSKLQILDIMNYFVDKKECLFEILTWNKTNPTPQTNNCWLPDIEYCLYFREKGKVVLNDGYEHKSKWYISSINKKDKDKFAHNTIKPLELVERHLLHTTQPNDIVLDCFIGSGTTAVACKNIGRNYLGFEINPKWAKIAEDRLNNIDANGQMSLFTF